MKVIVSVCTKVDGKVKVIVSSGFYTQKIEKWKRLFQSGFCTKIVVEDEICSVRIIQESLKGLKGVKMQDGNSVEILH